MISTLDSQTINQRSGRWRFRTGWKGRLVLQIEWIIPDDPPNASVHRRLWEDARLDDLDLMGEGA